MVARIHIIGGAFVLLIVFGILASVRLLHAPDSGPTTVGGEHLVASSHVRAPSDSGMSSTRPRDSEAEISIASEPALQVAFGKFPIIPYYEPESVADDYFVLREKANNGDLGSAHMLFRILRDCRNFAYETKAELEEAVVHLYNSYEILPTVEGGIPTTLDQSEDLVRLEAWVRKKFATCEGVTAEQEAEAESWLEFAGDRGYLPALRELTAGTPDIEKKIHYIQMSWDYGDITGLFNLGYYNSIGLIGGGTDHVNAYGQFLLFDLLLAESKDLYGERSDPWTAKVKGYLEHYANSLPEYQRKEAELYAFELLKANPNCCVAPHM